MRPGPFAPHERPRKKYTARSYSRSTLRPPNRYSASPPRTAVTIMSIESSSSGREGFHDHRRSLAASNAGGAQAETLPPAPQGVQQVDRDARAGCSERVADRDGTAVHDPGRVAGGDEPILLEVGLEAEQYLQRGFRSHVLVLAVLDGLPLLLDGDPDHLVLEDTGIPRLLGALLRCERDLVHFLAGELVALGQVFRRLGHGESALWVLERLPQEVFEGSGGAEPQPPPGAAHDMGGLAHGLRATPEHRVRLAQQGEIGRAHG